MSPQRGFSLVEALIALLVLSLGLVGVAAMQLKALQSASVGYQRSVVTLAAVDAQERLWAALAQLPSGGSCEDISVDNAITLQGSEDNQGWNSYWFEEESLLPTRNFEGAIYDQNSERYNLDSCEFLIEVSFGSETSDAPEDTFTYTFSLPNDF